jgi:hypothetical protein
MKLEKSKAVYTTLAVLAILLIVGSLTNWSLNIFGRYSYLDYARMSLHNAQTAHTPEEKEWYINETIQLYKEGPNLEKIKLLTFNNATQEFGKVEGLVNAELYSKTLLVPRFIVTGIFQILILFFGFVGTFDHYKIYWVWRDRKRNTFYVSTAILFIATLANTFV